MKTLILVKPTKERNGIQIRKTKNCINSCELRKISVSNRDNGYIASINISGKIVLTGFSWRSKIVAPPVAVDILEKLVAENMDEIKSIINNPL